MAGHRAVLRLTPLLLFINVVTCVALFAVALYVSTPGVVRLVGFGVVAVIFAPVIYSAFVAGNAAKSADAHRMTSSGEEDPDTFASDRHRAGRECRWGRTHEPRVSFPIGEHHVHSQLRQTADPNIGEDHFTDRSRPPDPHPRPSCASVPRAHD